MVIVALIIVVAFATLDRITYAQSPAFDAITKVKDRVPFDEKKRVWYSGEWTQRRLDGNIWEVRVSDGVWRVGRGAVLCSETSHFVDICSQNGTAKRYTGLPYCKPPSVCGQ